jgi:hypothetical protein
MSNTYVNTHGSTVTEGVSASSEAGVGLSNLLCDLAINGQSGAADALVELKNLTFQGDDYHATDGNVYTK